jgi:pimeloyl-ACP methyl ester carboxylesterase
LSGAWLLFFPVGGEEDVHRRICDAVELAGGRERVRPGEHDLVHRLVNDETGELVGGQCRVGGGDTAPYAVQREIEDLAALIADAGAPVFVCGFSSGAVLALDAAAAGLPIESLALFEPPFVVDASRPPLPADYVARLDACTADGRPGDAAELFLTAAAGMPVDFVAGVQQSPFWPALEGVAHTIAYDGRIMGPTMSGKPLPTDRWAAVNVPTLVMHGRGTEPWLIAAAHALADLLPTATLRAVEGEQHNVAAEVLAPVLREFASTEHAATDVQ